MDMTRENRIRRRATRLAALNDPETLEAPLPGCETLEPTRRAILRRRDAEVGPVRAKFKGQVTLSDLNPPESYKISGEGKGGAAGFAKGGAEVKLAEDGPEATVLTYTAKADVGGKLAQLGSRLIDATAKKMADEFLRISAAAGSGAGARGCASGRAGGSRTGGRRGTERRPGRARPEQVALGGGRGGGPDDRGAAVPLAASLCVVSGKPLTASPLS